MNSFVFSFYLAKDDSDEADAPAKERHHHKHKREKSRDREPRDKRDQSPPRDPHNDTKDSWAAASPAEKQRYQSQPNQEVENMDAKIERLKVGRKFERRLSEM